MIFIQRDPISRTGAVTYQGDAARVLKDGVVIRDWTAGGAIAGVPQGDGYTLQVRNGATITSDDLSIGIIVSALGQSNLGHWFSDTSNSSGGVGYQLHADGTWSAVAGTAARVFSAILSAGAGAPVGIIDSTRGGTSLQAGRDYGQGHWLDDTQGSVYDLARNAVAGLGGKAEFALWGQGEADAGTPTATYATSLTTMFDWIHRDFGGARILVQEIGPYDAGTGPSGARYDTIRQAQDQVVKALGYADIGATTLDASMVSDGMHLDGASRARAAAEMALSSLDQLGLGGQIARWTSTAGDDGRQGGAGIDFLYGGSGEDTLRGGGGNDVIDGGDGTDALFGEDGDDILIGGLGDDRLDGGIGNDVFGGGLGSDKLYGQDGNDELWGGGGDDRIDAGVGDDIVYGGLGNDVILGGSGNDRISADEGDDFVDAGAGDDAITGGPGADTLIGGAGRDIIYASSGDTVSGGDDNDIVFLDSPPTSVDGGTGSDTLRLPQTIKLAAGSIASIERVEVADHTSADLSGFSAGVYAAALSFAGGGATIRGTSYVDTIVGGGGNDSFYAGTGDHVTAGDGNDLVFLSGVAKVDGGGGADTVRVTANAMFAAGAVVNVERIEVMPGVVADFSALAAGIRAYAPSSGGGVTTIIGTALADTLIGGPGLDALSGGTGSDSLSGGIGDTLQGGADNDYLQIDGTPDLVDGGAGLDRLRVIGDVTFSAGSVTNVEAIEVVNGGRGDFAALGPG